MLAPGQTRVEVRRRGEWGQPNVSSESGIWGIHVCFWSGVRRWSDILQSLGVSAEVTDEMLLKPDSILGVFAATHVHLARCSPAGGDDVHGWQK